MAASPRPLRSQAFRIAAARLVVIAAGLVSFAAAAEDADQPLLLSASVVEPAAPGAMSPAMETAWWREGVAVFATLWDDTRARLADDMPDWLQHRSRRQP